MNPKAFLIQQLATQPDRMEWPPIESDGAAAQFTAQCTNKKWFVANGMPGFGTHTRKYAVNAADMYGLRSSITKTTAFADLPEGYVLYAGARPDGIRFDYYLMGHPSGGHFFSTVEAWTHFRYLIFEDPVSRGECGCKLCLESVGKKFIRTTNKAPKVNKAPLSNKAIQRPRKMAGIPDETIYGLPRREIPFEDLPLQGEPYANAPADFTHPYLLQAATTGKNDLSAPANGHLDIGSSAKLNASAPAVGGEEAVSQDAPVADRLTQALYDVTQHLNERNTNQSRTLEAFTAAIDESLETMLELPSIVARVGEVILFCEDVQVSFNGSSSTYDTQQGPGGEFLQAIWHFGIVTEVNRDGYLLTGDVKSIKYTMDWITEGEDATWQPAKRYADFELTRPFSMLSETIGSPKDTIGHTFEAARTVFGKIALCGPPISSEVSADGMKCRLALKAIWIGPELIILDDVVRLFTRENDPKITRVLVVESIVMELQFLNGEWDRPRIMFGGLAFDDHPHKATYPIPCDDLDATVPVMDPQVNAEGIEVGGKWYMFKNQTQHLEKEGHLGSFYTELHTVVGRLHEPVEVERLTGLKNINYGHFVTAYRHSASVVNAEKDGDTSDVGLKIGATRVLNLGLYYFNMRTVGDGLIKATHRRFPWKHPEMQWWMPGNLEEAKARLARTIAAEEAQERALRGPAPPSAPMSPKPTTNVGEASGSGSGSGPNLNDQSSVDAIQAALAVVDAFDSRNGDEGEVGDADHMDVDEEMADPGGKGKGSAAH